MIADIETSSFKNHFLFKQFYSFLLFNAGITKLTFQIIQEGLRKLPPMSLIIEQVYQIGIRSLPLIFITTCSIGMVMALQFGISLEKFGGKIYVPKVVSLSIVRELGPVFASMMIAARIGSGMTSEIGSMLVTEQISAIRALGTSPIQKIVLPRVIGCFIALPFSRPGKCFWCYGGIDCGNQRTWVGYWLLCSKNFFNNLPNRFYFWNC